MISSMEESTLDRKDSRQIIQGIVLTMGEYQTRYVVDNDID